MIPTFLARLRTRARALFGRDAVAEEIHDELQFHLQARIEQYERDGLDPDAARRKARRRIGNLAVHQDRGYDVRGGGAIATVVQDVRYAVRLLRRERGFAMVAIATLALGIGGSTALFSVIDATLLRPVPYPAPEQLAEVTVDTEIAPGDRAEVSPSNADVATWRTSGRLFSHIAIAQESLPQVLVDGEAERVQVLEVSPQYFAMLGIVPLHGRGFVDDDVRPGAPRALVVGHAYWRQRFGADPLVVGRMVRLGDDAATIVGVLSPGLAGEKAVFLAHRVTAERVVRRGQGGTVYIRVRPGVGFDAAAQELTTIAAGSPSAVATDGRIRLTSLVDRTAADYRTTVRVIASAIVLIFALACVNVAGLLLARGATRQSELAIRASIGAGRARLVRQLITESLVLALAGGVAGIGFAWLLLDTIVANIPRVLATVAPISLNLRVLAAGAGLTVMTGLLCGVWPALRLSRAHPVGATPAKRHQGTALTRRGGQLLIAVEISLALVLLAGAGLMLRSFTRILHVDLGFDPSAFLTMEVAPVDRRAEATYYTQLLDAIRRLPGVAEVGAIDSLPLGESLVVSFVRTPGGEFAEVGTRQVLPGYFQAVGLALRQGELPTGAEPAGSAPVVLNEQAARMLFRGAPAVGRVIEYEQRPRQVVGVVSDLRQWGPLVPAEAELYVPFAPAVDTQAAFPLAIVVRPHRDASVSGTDLVAAARSIGPPVVIDRIRSGVDWFGDRVARPRQRTLLIGLLGGLGMVLALVGVLGVTSYAVARRTQEIGVRMAFGAERSQIIRMMLRDVAVPVAIGIVAGLMAAAIGTRVIESFLFQTTPTDPGTFAAAAVVLSLAALTAAWHPARRAASVDPVRALRAD